MLHDPINDGRANSHWRGNKAAGSKYAETCYRHAVIHIAGIISCDDLYRPNYGRQSAPGNP